MKLRVHADTDIGLVRSENQDAYLTAFEHGVFAVADGVGGLPAGAESAAAVIQSLADSVHALEPGQALDLEAAFATANNAVVELGRRIGQEYNTGTTLTVVQILGRRLSFGHVGDSALHLFRGPHIQKLTLDHTVASDTPFRFLFPELAEPSTPQSRNVLTRCMGSPDTPRVDIGSLDLQPGDRILLSTDGVFKGVEPEEVRDLFLTRPGPEPVVGELLRLVNDRGGWDNATAVLIYTEEAGAAAAR